MSRETKRLLKELADIKAQADDPECQVYASMIADDITKWRGRIKGPVRTSRVPSQISFFKDGTPYEGGVFYLKIDIPSDYPYTAPKIQFETRIWHPNISSQTGAICLDILKNEWSPALTIRTALLSIQALLSSPEPNDPQDAEVASVYLENKELFDQIARTYTMTFAQEKLSTEETKIQKLVEMGFDRGQCESVLKEENGNEHNALERLLESSNLV